MKQYIGEKASRFTESVIREMTRLAYEHGAINLAQGYPNFAAPQAVKDAACRAIQEDVNQYAVTWGAPSFRRAVAEKYRRDYGWDVDPDVEVTVACGSTECMISTMLALVNPGEQVVVFEPFYENYGPDSIIAGATPIHVSLESESDWALDFDVLEGTIRQACDRGRLRALILNSPNNPSGKVFNSDELNRIAELAVRYDFYVFTDEIYEHILYDGHVHQPIALLPGMRERTVTISALSKTFSVTGWRVGYTIAPGHLAGAIRKMHDFLTVGSPAPLQEAGVTALAMESDYYDQLARDYLERRDFLMEALVELGFRIWKPAGAYYIMADISQVTDKDDVDFAAELVRELRGRGRPRQQLLPSRQAAGKTTHPLRLLQDHGRVGRGPAPALAAAERQRAIREPTPVRSIPRALTVAGSDSGGCAGIQARSEDLRGSGSARDERHHGDHGAGHPPGA